MRSDWLLGEAEALRCTHLLVESKPKPHKTLEIVSHLSCKAAIFRST
jgi:hypothetical protein